MIVELKISDELYKEYARYNTTEPEKSMAFTLKRFVDVPPGDRVIVIDKANRQKLEAILNETTTSAEALIDRFKDLLKIKVQDAEVVLTPETLERLKDQADFEGSEPREYFERKIREGIEIAVLGYVS